MKPAVKLNKDLCKQCGICIHLCPKQVYIRDDEGYPKPVKTEQCTGCRLCCERCPDFALEVEDNEQQ